MLISPFTLSYSTEDRRLQKETGNSDPTLTMHLESWIHISPTQQKTPEFFHVSLSSYLKWRIQIWIHSSAFHHKHYTQFWMEVVWMLAFVLNPPLSPQADLPNLALQEMSNQRNLLCSFWWCFQLAKTLSLTKMVLFLNKDSTTQGICWQNWVPGLSETKMTADGLANSQSELKCRHPSFT